MPEKISYYSSAGVSAAGGSWWLIDILHRLTPDDWIAFGVLINMLFGGLTFAVHLYFQIKRNRRRVANRGK